MPTYPKGPVDESGLPVRAEDVQLNRPAPPLYRPGVRTRYVQPGYHPWPHGYPSGHGGIRLKVGDAVIVIGTPLPVHPHVHPYWPHKPRDYRPHRPRGKRIPELR